MKKKIFVVLFALLLLIPFGVSAKEKAKVKVYVFEAGGCPYCEAELEYLQGLESYNKKFVIVRKELYVDHVNWAQGRDYKLGKAVAEKFQKDGFEDASYSGTPFVVISNVYAAATYSTNLESYINKAYKDGDKDVVGKIAKDLGVENVDRQDIMTDGDTPTDTNEGEVSSGKKPNAVVVLIGVAVLVGAMIIVIKLGGNKGNDEKEEVALEEEKEEVIEEKPATKAAAKKTPVKKAPVKKAPAKKVTTKKPVKKTNKK